MGQLKPILQRMALPLNCFRTSFMTTAKLHLLNQSSFCTFMAFPQAQRCFVSHLKRQIISHQTLKDNSAFYRFFPFNSIGKVRQLFYWTKATDQRKLPLASLRSINITSIHCNLQTGREYSNKGGPGQTGSNKTGLIYIVSVFILMLGGSYAGVPLYKVFCQAAGLGGQAIQGHNAEKVETMTKVDRKIVVNFNADVASSMRWSFRPQQTEVTVHPGETALAFYTAKNPTDKPIIGISTYNVLPYDAGQYFNKIQCFCFEEQRLNPHEQVDMPVFFYIDPEFAEDPKLENVDSIVLSYTFFEAKEGLHLPLPGYQQIQATNVN
ncbi:unnamed protein product [Lymnaea stagnalis]|uniref:Cytochrome c oxidase assembly protein COX11, mitochondrial n=1 Tax=Lymnaea stagnalis TaxID=6523 RepID=A0AAV2IMN6_LYMST